MAPTPSPVLESQSPIGSEGPDSGFLMSPRNNSLTVTNTKGLLNMPGQNNCFLNSAVQVLWHLDIFRRSFRELSGHACMAESCIFCALKELFTQFQYSQESALPPDALRHALARTFCDQRRFQLGFMDDAAECFENILLRIHVHIANQEHEDMCGDQHCIPHQKFAMTIVEQPICANCGTTSEPLPFTQMVHYVTTSALCSKALELHKQGVAPPNSFGTLLQLAGDVGEVRKCSSNCGSKIHMKKTLMNHPEIVSIGLVWDSECSSAQHITDVFHCIGMCLKLKDMFHGTYDCEWADNTYHELVGVVTYYGKHYSTFFFHTKLRVWIYFDDAAVREIGPSWDSVVEKCQKGRFQPLLLLFANPNGSSLSPSAVNHDMPLHHLPYQSSSTKLASIKQATIQKYLSLQNKMPSDFARSNYKHFRERPNSYEHLQRHDVPAYPLQSIVPDLSNGTRSSVTNAKSYGTAMPVYSNTSILGIPIPSTNYANVNSSNSVSLPNHIYSNVHIPNFQPQNLAESLPQISSATKGNENFLPPLHNPRYASRGNALLYSETPEMLQYKPKDNADAKDSDSAFTEEDPENETYISRKTVENVLNLQRHMTLSRSYSHSSVGNRNSSSSLESFDNLHCAKLNNNPVIPDPANFSRRRDSKDSGHWTGDRNSSSSSTTTENPFLTVFAAKRLMLGLNTSAGKGQLPDYGNPNTSDHGYDSYSVSSSDSYPSITNSPVKLDPRLTQIPEDWSMQEGGNDLDSKLKMVTEESGPPDCDKLCAEADLLLAKSHEKEKEGDLVMAALLSDSAAARARAAMEAPYNNSRSLVSAKMKHSTCVMRSACLYRRLKESEADERRKMKGHHSRQSSRDSTHSRHSRQGSKDSSNTKQSPKETGNQVFEDLENFGKNIEIYGTLPKKGSKKKNSMSALTSKAKDDEVYKDFLDKQRKNITTGTANTEHTSKTSKPSHSSETVKSKLCEKTSKSNLTEGAPKAPLRKKGDGSAVKDDVKQNGLPKKGKQKQPIEQSYALLFPSHSDAANEVDANNKDLLSPLNSPDKKQHRIKRKLMGGFMKRKNRSLPDLRADEELSDDFERSVDDAAISMPSTLTLPNGTLKKLEKLTDSGAVSRGFHQPHHAFIKKDLTQRPLLMKVNPPNIQSSMVNGSVSKLTHTLPSIPKKHIESKPRNETQYISDKPSKIPFKTSLNKSDIPPHPSHLLHPLKCDSKQLPQTSMTQKVSSIPVLSQQSQALKCEVSNDSSTDGKIATPKNPTPSEELPSPPPPNSFLAEIQAKRKQIIDAKDNRESPKDLRSPKPLQPINSKPSHLPKLTFGNNNEGTSWLKELQSKQMQMKQKHHDVSTSITSQGTSSQVMKEKVQAGINNSTHTKPIQSNKAVPVQQNTSEVKHRNSFSQQSDDVVPLPDESKTKNCEKKTPGSVKDLASKFEKILVKPKESPSSLTDINTSNSDGTKNQPASKPTRQQNSTETVCDSVEKSQSADTEKTNENLHGGLPPPPTPLPEQRIAHMSLSGNSIQRPQQPPDYETAMQRLELIRTHPHSASANLHQKYLEGDKLPTPRSPSAPSSFSESPKKKSGPKKTVTFSDEVVLVACAEFDDSGFFTNPLLERVYQKHIESGGTEISHFSTVGSHNKSIKLSDTNQEVQNRSADNTGKYNMASDDASELIPCHLCHNKYISPTMTYCTDCAFYMSRYQQ